MTNLRFYFPKSDEISQKWEVSIAVTARVTAIHGTQTDPIWMVCFSSRSPNQRRTWRSVKYGLRIVEERTLESTGFQGIPTVRLFKTFCRWKGSNKRSSTSCTRCCKRLGREGLRLRSSARHPGTVRPVYRHAKNKNKTTSNATTKN